MYHLTFILKKCERSTVLLLGILTALYAIHVSHGRVIISKQHAYAGRWGYQQNTDETPPQAWGEKYPACKGARQSPVLIKEGQVKNSPRLGRLRFRAYRAKPKKNIWTVLNNGHTVQFSGTFSSKQQPTLSRGGLPADYIFTQFHFHWGNTAKRGSEHVIDNKRFPLELHIVHRKVNENDAQVQEDPSGLAVLAVLFELTTEKDRAHKQIDSVIDALNKVLVPDKPTNIRLDHLTLKKLLPRSAGFYRYRGSLTTPPCTEAVEWSVLDKTLYITERQLQAFRALHRTAEGSSASIGDNFRPLQAANGRVIEHYTRQG